MNNTIIESYETDNLDLLKTQDYKKNIEQIFERACAFGSLGIISFILTNHKKEILNKLDTGLYYACKTGNYKTVSRLIEEGADVHQENSVCLEVAAEFGFINVMEILINANCNIHRPRIAISSIMANKLESLELLCDYGFNLQENKEELIRVATELNNDKIIEFINKYTK